MAADEPVHTTEPVRSVFVQWASLNRDAERVLDDLARLTDVNTIELSNFYLDWGELYKTPAADEPAPLALPSGGFGDMPVAVLDDATFDSVLHIVDQIRSRGFRVALNLTPLYASSQALAGARVVDAMGEPVAGTRSNMSIHACPSSERGMFYGEEMARAFVRAWPRLDALTINHVEYPIWPQGGLRELSGCFCDSCRFEAEAQGIDFERMRKTVVSALQAILEGRGLTRGRSEVTAVDMLRFLVARPGLVTWLRFRGDVMSAFVRRVVAAARAAGEGRSARLELGLEFQLPAYCALVGTDFVALADLFDWLSPKFPDYLQAAIVPAVADELAAASGAEPARLRRAIRGLLELGPGPDVYEPLADTSEGILYGNTFDMSVIDNQQKYVEEVRGCGPLYPYLFLYKDDIEKLAAKRRALRAHGYDGYFLWCWDRHLTTRALEASRAALGPQS